MTYYPDTNYTFVELYEYSALISACSVSTQLSCTDTYIHIYIQYTCIHRESINAKANTEIDKNLHLRVLPHTD